MDMNFLLKIVFFTVITAFLILVAAMLVQRAKPELVVTPGLLFYELFKRGNKKKKGDTTVVTWLVFALVVLLVVGIVAIIMGYVFFGWNPLASIFKSKFLSWIPFF